MNINIENLHLHIYLNEAPTAENLEQELAEQLSRAEKALYETASEEAEATAGNDDYWDRLFTDAEEALRSSDLDEEPEQPAEFAVGDYVKVTIDWDAPQKGWVGKIVQKADYIDTLFLVEFPGWTGGHDGHEGPKGSRWWMLTEDFVKTTKPVLYEGARVIHTGKGKPDGFSGKHAGYKGVSLIGKTGTIVHLDDNAGALVRFNEWGDGHDGLDRDGTTNNWWVYEDNLEVVN